MFGRGQLDQCQQRKAALLQRSAIHRRTLIREAASLRPVVGWVDQGIEFAHKARMGWSVLVPLLALRRDRAPGSGGLLQRISGVLSLARAIREAWRRWR